MRVADQASVRLALGQVDDDAPLGTAVVLAHDHVLRHVHQTTGQVTRVGGAKRGVGQTLTGTVGVDEVLQHRQPLAERGLDRPRDELTLRVGHQTLHAGQRAGLGEVTRGARIHDRDDRVVIGVVRPQRLADLFGGLLPQLDEGVVALLMVQGAALVLALDAVGFRLVALEDLRLLRRHQHVGHRHGDTRPGGPVEAGVLELVHGLRDHDHRVALGQIVDDPGLDLLVHLLVDERITARQQLVEEHPAQRGLGDPGIARAPAVLAEQLRLDLVRRTDLGQAHLDLGAHAQRAAIHRHDRLGRRAVHTALRLVLGRSRVLAGVTGHVRGQVVQTGDHVQTRHGQRLAEAGDRMLLLDSIRMRASACASALSGRCTAIWSPSKSALNASQTSGCS